jgi:uncharacterized lipoprotein YddW (UPF0748 family)
MIYDNYSELVRCCTLLLIKKMVSTAPRFSDIQNHHARAFIEALAGRGIVNGFPDRTYRPDNSMTRAEFASVISKAFSLPQKRQYVAFTDVPSNHWAFAAIQRAFETGFISGFPDRTFRPADRITRADVLTALVNGLDIATGVKPDLLPLLPQLYQDAALIPSYARVAVAIATRVRMVVSFPNRRLFNPILAATRGDVAGFVYQALVYQKQAPEIASDFIVVPPLPGERSPLVVSVNHRRELRGAWIASAWNVDWPKLLGLSVAQQQGQLLAILDRLQALNFNAIYFQVRPEGDALYASQLEPWSAWLTGTQGKAPEPFYDPLAFAIAECRKRNIECHAWFNPYRARARAATTLVRPHLGVTNPDVVYPWGTQLWMDPGAKVVQDRTYNVIMDVVRRYDIDGVHLDDYFYPYPIQGQTFPDNRTYAAYREAGGTLRLEDWRRDNVNKMVQRLATGIRAAKPHVKFGISPFGIYRPGEPPQIRGLDAFNVLFADAKKWLESGWVDYLAPQLYWEIDATAQSYPVLLQWWTSINPQKRHIYAGNTLGKLDVKEGKQWESGELEKQVRISRSLERSLSLGNIFFKASALVENTKSIFDALRLRVYTEPALPPTMPWLSDRLPPASPVEIQVRERQVSWKAADDQDVRYWTLYCQNSDDTWTLQRILPGSARVVNLDSGIYALCAVDRLANESVGEVVFIG